MRHDDRLATVLRIRPASPAVARIQFQQLVDLLGTSPADARGELLDDAYVRIIALSARIPAGERAAALGLAGLRLRSPRLVASLCSAEPLVAQAAIRAADLDEAQWLDLIPALPPASRGLLRAKRDFPPQARALLARLGIGDAALPGQVAPPEAPAAEPAEPEQTVIPLPLAKPAPAAASGGIAAIVERIEAFRRARDAAAPAATAPELPQLPLGDADFAPPASLATVDFKTDPAGHITWCQHPATPLLVGTSLAGFEPLHTPIRQRQPIRAVTLHLTGAPAIAGEWQVDAVPRFEAGRFTGYIGRLRRALAVSAPAAAPTREADSLRQVLHELRTPVNAIQGFAEIIQHQLYGPTPHEYRALAAAIVTDAARMLAGFEELERLARLQTGAVQPEAGECDFAAIAAAAIARLQPQAQVREFQLSLAMSPASLAAPLPVPLATAEAERLCWRLLATVAATAGTGENLACTLATEAGSLRLAIPLPAALDAESLFSASAPPPVAVAPAPGGMFGTGFALRLARAEARAFGGSLTSTRQTINLRLPLLTSVIDHGDNGLQGRSQTGVSTA